MYLLLGIIINLVLLYISINNLGRVRLNIMKNLFKEYKSIPLGLLGYFWFSIFAIGDFLLIFSSTVWFSYFFTMISMKIGGYDVGYYMPLLMTKSITLLNIYELMWVLSPLVTLSFSLYGCLYAIKDLRYRHILPMQCSVREGVYLLIGMLIASILSGVMLYAFIQLIVKELLISGVI